MSGPLERAFTHGLLIVFSLIAVYPLVSVLFSVTSGRFADRVGHRWLIAAGATTCSLAFVWLLLFVEQEPAYLTAFLPANLLLGVGIGLSVANFTGAALSEVAADRFAIANATSRTVQQVAYAFGVAVFVSLLTENTGAIDHFTRPWVYEVVMYAVAALLVLVLFPRGSVTARRVTSSGTSPPIRGAGAG